MRLVVSAALPLLIGAFAAKGRIAPSPADVPALEEIKELAYEGYTHAYPLVDDQGAVLDGSGSSSYVVHFAAGQLPPVNASWSVSLYDDRQFFVENPIDRYAIDDRDRLRYNDDGSLDLTIQHASPGAGQESNWLPAPDGKFNLVMRLYWPKAEVLDQTWQPPGVDKVE